MFSRREFLWRTGALASLAPAVPTMLCRAARAAGAQPDARVLVVIQLDGGNDGLNTVVPFADDAYGRARIKLRLDADQLHRLDDYVGLHPQMKAAKELYDEGRLTIVQGVGYPNPDRSHFRSMRIWQTASFDDDAHDGYGWLGRAVDYRAAQAESASTDASAVFVGDDQPPVALWGRQAATTTMSRLEDMTLDSRLQCLAHDRALPRLRGQAAEEFTSESSSACPALDFVTRQVASSYASAEQFARDHGASSAAAFKYPQTKLADRLQLVSRLLKCGSQARVYYTMQSGYDTHSAQLYTHAQLLSEFAGALKAFLDDLHHSELADRVIVLAFSEFGRRVLENASQGTDHGAAGLVFLAGGGVNGGLLGEAPSLTDLQDGDLKAGVDFRQIYATLLHGWLNVPPNAVLTDNFSELPLWGA